MRRFVDNDLAPRSFTPLLLASTIVTIDASAGVRVISLIAYFNRSNNMSFLDLETTEEALLEDEELIEAVEAVVTKTSVFVWSEFVSDLQSAMETCNNVALYLFPVIADYRQDKMRLKEDIEHLALSCLLFVIAFYFLSPWQSDNNKRSIGRIKWFGKKRAPIKRSDSFSSSPTPSSTSLEEGSDQNSASDGLLIFGEQLEETDEERFRAEWPHISMSRYRKLVIPPECKRVEKPKSRPSPKNTNTKPETTEERKRKENKNDSDVNNEENPVKRLKGYVQHLMFFIRSLISYDYQGAAWTLILWMKKIRRYRRIKSDMNLNKTLDENIEDGDDEPEQDFVTKQLSSVSHTSVYQSKSSFCDQLEERENASLLSQGGAEAHSSSPSRRLQRFSSTESTTSSIRHDSRHIGNDDDDDDDFHSVASSLRKSSPLKCVSGNMNENSSNRAPLGLTEEGTTTQADTSALGTIKFSDDTEVPDLLTPPDCARTSKFFFDSTHSKSSLNRLAVEIPWPDKNGYILGDHFLRDSSFTPLLVFVNSKSGPQQGHLLITQLRSLLNPIQVWDLADGPPEPIVESFLAFTRLRLLVCGGDGTVSWIISAIDGMKLQQQRKKSPPIAILPLGTGNDLARIHGWGGGYNNESLITILEQVAESYVSLLDRWEVTIDDSRHREKKKVKTCMNYLGVGCDAQMALQVHYLRESRPDWFFSRMFNKLWYGIFGAENIIKASSLTVRKDIKLVADGVEIPIPKDSQGIIVLNIDCYAGGTPLWSHGIKADDINMSPGRLRKTKSMDNGSAAVGPQRLRAPSIDRFETVDEIYRLMSKEEKFACVTACDRPASCQDGILEIVSVRGAFHLGQIRVGLSYAQRICQCHEVSIVIKNKLAVQIDGEPWRQRACTLNIKRKKDPSIMLHRSSDTGDYLEMEMAKLLDWGAERQLIDSQAHSILMKEFSRRIESKTRQKRGQDHMAWLKRAIASSSALSNMPSSNGDSIAF